MPTPLGDNLRRARRAADLTQDEAATRLDVSKQAVSDWERGVKAPTEKNLVALAELYGTTPAALRYGSTNAESDDVFAEIFDSAAAGSKSIVPKGIPQRIRLVIQRFLLELTEAGVPGAEVDGVRRILSADELHRVNWGGEREYTEDEILEGVEAHVTAFRQRFRRKGYELGP